MRDFTGIEEDITVDERLMHALTRLSRLHFMLLHQVQERQSLYPGQPQLMSYLMHGQQEGHPLPSQRELAKHLCIRPATLTVTLRRMESAGLIRRVADETDARVQRVMLTEAGESVIQEFHRDFRKVSEDVFQELPEDEKQRLLISFTKLNQYLFRKLPHHQMHGKDANR